MGLTGKLLITLLAIDIMLFIGGANTGNDLLIFGEFFDINATRQANGTITDLNFTAGNFTDNILPSSTGVLNQLFQTFIIPIFLIINFLNVVFSFLFAPITFLTLIGAPVEINLLVGGTIIILFIIGLINIIRGGDL